MRINVMRLLGKLKIPIQIILAVVAIISAMFPAVIPLAVIAVIAEIVFAKTFNGRQWIIIGVILMLVVMGIMVCQLFLNKPIPPRVNHNSEWQNRGFIHNMFDDIDMVLVPACSEQVTNRNQNNVCVDYPYWIDRYEVTRILYDPNSNALTPMLPQSMVNIIQAKEHCENRPNGARLPTDQEWEYAAAGPDGWEYPWGEESKGTELVYLHNPIDNPTGKPKSVGSIDEGESWIGANDMSGNVWEWVIDDIVEGDFLKPALRGGSYKEDLVSAKTSYKVSSFQYVNLNNPPGDLFNSDDTGFRCVRDFQPGDPITN